MTAIPPMPWTIVDMPYQNRTRKTKVFPNGMAELPGPFDVAVWEHVQALEARNAELEAAIAQVPAKKGR